MIDERIEMLKRRLETWIKLEYNYIANDEKYYSNLIRSTTLQAAKNVYKKKLEQSVLAHKKTIDRLNNELKKL